MTELFTAIDAIRKKHEERKKKLAMAPFEYVTGLSVADVDALFAALDEARGPMRALDPGKTDPRRKIRWTKKTEKE